MIPRSPTSRPGPTPPQLQGRTAAATNLALNLPQTLATMVAAAVIASVDYRWLLLVTAVGVLLAAVAAPWRQRVSATAAPGGAGR